MRNRSWGGVGRRKSPRKEASGETDVPSTASQPREDEGRWAGLMDPSRLLPREGSSPRDTVLHHPPCSWDPDSVTSCKTQNSGPPSKEEKPRDPIIQSSRCNTQEGLLSVTQTGDSDLLGGRAHRTANWASFL